MKPDSMGVSMFGSKPGGQATRTVPLGSAMASAATTAAASAAATIDSDCSCTARPTGVIRKPRVDRSIKRTPYRSSSLATRLLSEDLVTCSARAAALNPPCCTTLAKAKRSLRSCIWKPLLSSFGKRYVLNRLSSSDFVAGPDLRQSKIWRLRCYRAPALGRCGHLQGKERNNMNQPAVNSGNRDGRAPSIKHQPKSKRYYFDVGIGGVCLSGADTGGASCLLDVGLAPG